MKPSILLIIFFLLAAGGGGGLFYYEYQLPDVDFIRRDVNERLLKIDNLDSSVNEYALRSRVNIDNNYDNLVRVTVLLDREIRDLETDYFSDSNLQGTLLLRHFNQLKNALETKNDLIENFKSHNSVLRNSEKYAPLVGRELMFAAEDRNLTEAARLYREIAYGSMHYAKPGSDANVGTLTDLLYKIPETESLLPGEFLTRIIELTNHIATVIAEKDQTDAYLSKVLSSATDIGLKNLSSSWRDWLDGLNAERDYFNKAAPAYIAMLLLFTGFIAIRLRSLYSSLDQEVAQQTAKVEQAYEELSQSEKNLMQSEKLASLGQLVAGVAHEINTPLGYINCNLDTVRSSMSAMGSLMNASGMMSDLVSRKPLDSKKLIAVVKSNVLAYRKVANNGAMNDINALLTDSTDGLQEISNLVSSLKDFSRLDHGDATLADVHPGLDATIKICAGELGDRELIRSYASDLQNIECMPAQLNQVFMNILNNAAHATDETNGIIEIETANTENGIRITFTDNGQGMDESTRSRMFDPFFTTKEVNVGTGLGMSISHKIIEAHGGEIQVKSQPGTGTQISLLLPMAR